MFIKLIFKKHKKLILAFLIPNLLFLVFNLFYNKENQVIAQVEELGAETCFKEVPIGGAIDQTEAFAKTILEQLKIMFEESARQEEAVQALTPLFDECKAENCESDDCHKWLESKYICPLTLETFDDEGECNANCAEACQDVSIPRCEVPSRCQEGSPCPDDEINAQLAIIEDANLKIKDAYNIIWSLIEESVAGFSDPDETEKYGPCRWADGIGTESCDVNPNNCGCERKVKAYEAFWPFLKEFWYWPNHMTRREMILKILDEVGSQVDFCVTPGPEEPERTLEQCKVVLQERFLLAEFFWQCPATKDIFPAVEACEFHCGGPGTCQQIEGVHPSHCSFFPLNYVCCEYAPGW